MKTLNLFRTAAAIVTLVGANSAFALSCTGAPPNNTRVLTIDAAACTAYGLGNLSTTQVNSTMSGLSLPGTEQERDTTFPNGGLLNIGVTSSTNSLQEGTWSIANDFWATPTSRAFLYFHFGGPQEKDQPNPDWFIVELTHGDTSGNWSIVPAKYALSGVSVIGIPDDGGGNNNVPEPGSIALAGFALLGAAATMRRRQSNKAR